MAKAGYDPHALISYLERVQRAPDYHASASSPLPPKGERIAALQREIVGLAVAERSPGGDFAIMQQSCPTFAGSYRRAAADANLEALNDGDQQPR